MTLLRNGKPKEAERVLEAHAQRKPDDPQVWYELAETHGLAGNIIAVHRARAEYFILNGALDLAERQLGYALDLAQGNFHATAYQAFQHLTLACLGAYSEATCQAKCLPPLLMNIVMRYSYPFCFYLHCLVPPSLPKKY